MKRVVLVPILAACVACGPRTSDKDNPAPTNGSTNGGTTNGATNGMTANGATNGQTANNANGSTNGMTNGQTSQNNANNTTNNNSTNNNSTNNTTTNNSTNNATNNPPGCSPDLTFTGQIGGVDEHDGGFVTDVNNIGDTGLAEVVAGGPQTPDDPLTMVDEGTAVLTPPITVYGARVIATGGPNGNQRFWLQDGFETIQVYLAADLPVTIRVGMTVTFDAMEVQNFEGHLQISRMSGFQVLSEDDGVPVRDATNRALTDDDYGRVVRIGGELEGPPVDCGGGKECFDIVYPGGTATFRTGSAFTQDGSCVTFVGPLYAFPGFYQSDVTPTLQLDTINFDWMWVQ